MNKLLDGITRPNRNPRPPENPPWHSSPGISNRVRAAARKPDGSLVVGEWAYNVMNTFGLASIASRIGTVSGTNTSVTTEMVSAMKIGTGTTAATSTDASLVASTGSVTMGNASFTKTNLGNMTVEYQATFASNNPAGTATITEVGLFCNSTADSQLLARAVLTGAQSVNKGASDVIQISYDTVYKSST